ncbi:MAG: ASPIC/UnbV domain-containing protein, partial [Candidatus Latescibacteria bacterium]|nr:ASPIC/UnbV domain-containing protein [Candidatus Latescibacterota bacterium]
ARVNGAAGYLGHNDTRLYFGLGVMGFVGRVDVQWLDGARDRIDYPPANKLLIVRQGRGYEAVDLR